MAIILEDIDVAPGCAYCRLRFQSGGITGLLNTEPNRCKINMKKIDQYCNMKEAPSKPDWCPAKAAIPIQEHVYRVPDIGEAILLRSINMEVQHDD